ncbi:Protein kinase superfamily [Klebsormidium nitens]|uniref:Protein kinase superfamily n=1 Tax=Klebsormidium nitens TaxID=105231 RepID=A0A1Y1IGU3_KLENI|nr:Protein kinase superfamily [Klebsormidium nitens]|eukprot:GAQ89863.1 Protein kinase superfamily [Klebsormidium nitens]
MALRGLAARYLFRRSSYAPPKDPGPKKLFGRRAALAGVLFGATGYLVFSEQLPESAPLKDTPLAGIRTGGQGVLRSSRAIRAFVLNSLDYKYTLRDMDKMTDEYDELRAKVHQRSAKRILQLCEKNTGTYVKAGQFLASLQGIPREYTQTLSVLQDQAKYQTFDKIDKVIAQELGSSATEIFAEFDPVPIAAASLAQVHRAVLKSTGQEVAVKVQYPGLQQQFETDITTMHVLSKAIAWLFPEYQFTWLVPEFQSNLQKELDFHEEGKNAERAAANFAHRKDLKIPEVLWDHTTKRVLTMEFVHGCKISDRAAIERLGLNAQAVSSLLVEIFAEMVFCHAWVHADPHPGNILVRQVGTAKKPRAEIVLLDHGLYRQIDERFRADFCQLWRALVLQDRAKMKIYGDRLGAGDYYKYFPVIFTGRSFSSKSKLGEGMSDAERAALREEVRAFTMGDLSAFMERLPRDMLTVLRTDGLVRSIGRALGGDVRERLLINIKYAILGANLSRGGNPDAQIRSWTSSIRVKYEYAQVRLRIALVEWVLRVRTIWSAFMSNFEKTVNTNMQAARIEI